MGCGGPESLNWVQASAPDTRLDREQNSDKDNDSIFNNRCLSVFISSFHGHTQMLSLNAAHSGIPLGIELKTPQVSLTK